MLLFEKNESLEWVAKYIIYSINLPSFFDFFSTVDERLENSTVNKFFQIWWISETMRLVTTLRSWSLIVSPQISQSDGEQDFGGEYLRL